MISICFACKYLLTSLKKRATQNNTLTCLVVCSPAMTDKLISILHQHFLQNHPSETMKRLFLTQVFCRSHDLPQFTSTLNLPRHAKIYNFHITKRIDAAQQNILRLEQKTFNSQIIKYKIKKKKKAIIYQMTSQFILLNFTQVTEFYF